MNVITVIAKLIFTQNNNNLTFTIMKNSELQRLNAILLLKNWHCEEHITAKYGLHWTIMSNNQKHKRQIVFSYKEGVEFANNIK